MGLSFPTISASGPNGSVIHYHPEESTNRPITTDEIYLCDSGAQYLYVVLFFFKFSLLLLNKKYISGMEQPMLLEHGILAHQPNEKLNVIPGC